MLSLRQKKQIWSKLRQLLLIADEVYMPIDAEPLKSKNLERVAIVVGGMAAQTGILLEILEQEIAHDEEQWRIDKEFQRLYEQEQFRLKPPPNLPADIKPTADDEDETGGLAKGM